MTLFFSQLFSVLEGEMETSWFGIPGATRKVNKLSEVLKNLVSHVKGLLRWTCWTDTFDYF